MADHPPPEIDPQQLKEAEALWKNFTVGGKYVIYATCAVLVLLALAFVKFI